MRRGCDPKIDEASDCIKFTGKHIYGQIYERIDDHCRRLVTADATGMAKEGDKTEVGVNGTGSESGDKHSETPRCTQVRGSP